MNASQLVHCRQSLQSFATDLRQLAVQAEALIEILEIETKGSDELRRERGRHSPQRLLERTTFTVHWGKKSCCREALPDPGRGAAEACREIAVPRNH